MTPRELACIQAIDACISQLHAIRLALATTLAEPKNEENNDTPEVCTHPKLQTVATMGGGKVSFCLDCEVQFEVTQ
jgi:hypothetical protein